MFRSVARRFVVTAVAFLAVLAVAPAVGTEPAPAGRQTLLVLGDSLSAEYGIGRGTGWVSMLSNRLIAQRRPYGVVNASISGETTAGGRTRLPDLLARHNPSIVLIELGGNDALRGLPLAGTEANLRQMVQASRQAGARPLLIGMQIPPNYGRAYANQFAAIFQRVASAERVPLVPFLLDGVDEPDSFLPDRIHPSEAAQPKLLENVWPVLEKML